MRGQFEIMSQILELCLLPRTQTNIKCNTGLNHAQIKRYLSLLTSRSLLERDSGKYMTTVKGRSFIDAIAQLNQALVDYTSTVSREATLRLQGKRQSKDNETTAFFAPDP